MNKIILIITIITIGILVSGTDIFAQKELQNKIDSLVIGGIYRVQLTDGRDITGELTGMGDSTIFFRTDEKVYSFNKDQIKIIKHGKTEYSSRNTEYDEYDYFKYFCSFQTGIEIPNGDFGVVHNTGYLFQGAFYTLLSRIIGMGVELKYEYFPSTEIENRYYDYYSGSYLKYKSETDNFHLYSLKLNLIGGNLSLENKLVFYGLAGAGLQYYDPWGQATYSYGGGCGALYKLSKNTGINIELQYNRLPPEENMGHYGGWYYYNNKDDEFDGCFSIRIGIMFMGL